MNGTTSLPTARYDVALIVRDMTVRGWNRAKLAKSARVSIPTISKFLSGEVQTAGSAAKISKALGRTVERYLIAVDEAVA